jgi:hypothetical protein
MSKTAIDTSNRFASRVRENNLDERMLLNTWRSALKARYYERLKDTIEPVLRSPTIQKDGTTARDALEAIAAYPSGIKESRVAVDATSIPFPWRT